MKAIVQKGFGMLLLLTLAAGALAACTTGAATAPPRVEAVLAAPPTAPAPITRNQPATQVVNLETVEERGVLASGVEYDFWTFGGTVPGSMIRVTQGDTVELTVKNNSSSRHAHNIDLHAVTGPGGGAAATDVAPGQEATLRFKALNPLIRGSMSTTALHLRFRTT